MLSRGSSGAGRGLSVSPPAVRSECRALSRTSGRARCRQASGPPARAWSPPSRAWSRQAALGGHEKRSAKQPSRRYTASTAPSTGHASQESAMRPRAASSASMLSRLYTSRGPSRIPWPNGPSCASRASTRKIAAAPRRAWMTSCYTPDRIPGAWRNRQTHRT